MISLEQTGRTHAVTVTRRVSWRWSVSDRYKAPATAGYFRLGWSHYLSLYPTLLAASVPSRKDNSVTLDGSVFLYRKYNFGYDQQNYKRIVGLSSFVTIMSQQSSRHFYHWCPVRETELLCWQLVSRQHSVTYKAGYAIRMLALFLSNQLGRRTIESSDEIIRHFGRAGSWRSTRREERLTNAADSPADSSAKDSTISKSSRREWLHDSLVDLCQLEVYVKTLAWSTQ